jgi:hypothetical protein
MHFFTHGEVPPDRRYMKRFRLVVGVLSCAFRRDELQNGYTRPTPEGPEES